MLSVSVGPPAVLSLESLVMNTLVRLSTALGKLLESSFMAKKSTQQQSPTQWHDLRPFSMSIVRVDAVILVINCLIMFS
jgi:hypothetical protein